MFFRSVALSPDGQQLATVSEDTVLRVWNITPRRLVHALRGHTHDIFAVDWSPDGARVLTASGDGTARLWDAGTGACVFRATFPSAPGATSVCFSRDGARFATGTLGSLVHVWDAATGALIETFTGHTAPVYAVVFSPDGTRVASGALDNTVRIHRIGTGCAGVEALTGLLTTTAAAARAAASAAAAATPGHPRPLAQPQQQGTTVLSEHTDYVLSLSWPAGPLFVDDGLKPAVAESPAAPPQAHESPHGERAEPEAGHLLLSASKDGTVVVWDTRTGRPAVRLAAHGNAVLSVATAQVGGRIATGSADYSARVWSC